MLMHPSSRSERYTGNKRNARIPQEDFSQILVLRMQNKWDDFTIAYSKLEIAHEAIGKVTEN